MSPFSRRWVVMEKTEGLVGSGFWMGMKGWPPRVEGHGRRHAKETEKPQPWQGGDDVEVISIWIGKEFREVVGWFPHRLETFLFFLHTIQLAKFI